MRPSRGSWGPSSPNPPALPPRRCPGPLSVLPPAACPLLFSPVLCRQQGDFGGRGPNPVALSPPPAERLTASPSGADRPYLLPHTAFCGLPPSPEVRRRGGPDPLVPGNSLPSVPLGPASSHVHSLFLPTPPRLSQPVLESPSEGESRASRAVTLLFLHPVPVTSSPGTFSWAPWASREARSMPGLPV